MHQHPWAEVGPGQWQAVLLTEGPESPAVESWGVTSKWMREGGEGKFGTVGAAPPVL